ncbi:hypothetical protein [Arthrobacter sp. UYCo732]|uniref:hypothetical protein n=1 Tax=Arthrobacter sp. UYCo732 TaxID=3156336 RepID=UPI0033923706
MSILAISVTTIECDGHNGAPCPNDAVIEFARPQSVAIRLAQNSGWTVWIETMCPECSQVTSVAADLAPAAPVMLSAALPEVQEAIAWTPAAGGSWHPRVPAAA